MSYKIYQRTTSKIRYDKGLFSYEQDKLADLLDKYCTDHYIRDDSNCLKETWEISTVNIKQVIQGLKNDYKSDDIVFTDWTQQKLIDTFERWINVNEKNKANLDYPELIILDWL